MSIWLHRITHHAEFSFPLLKNHNLLSIGFSDFLPDFLVKKGIISNDEDFMGRAKQEGMGYLDELYPKVWGENHQALYLLNRFLKMKKGDRVVVPEQGKFSVYEILDDQASPITSIAEEKATNRQEEEVKIEDGKLKQKKDNSVVDLGFVRKVKPVQIEIPRAEYANAQLSKKLRYPRTNNDITEAEESVDEAVKGYEENKPINVYQDLVNGMKGQILENIKEKLTHNKLETLIQWYFVQCGATETEIPAKNESGKEGDADVIATFEPLKTIYYVQAKFHEGKTSVEAADQIVDYVNNQNTADDDYHRISWVISTADGFDKKIREKADANHVKLINGEELAEMILEIGIHDLDRWV